MAKAQKIIVRTDKAPKPVGMYSQAVRTSGGELLFIAGTVAVDMNGNLVGQGDIKAQTRQVFQNIGGVLAGVGATHANVVQLTTYVVGRESVQGFLDARTDLFPKIYPGGEYPPNTLLVVNGLARPEWLIEVQAIAAIG